MKYVKTLFAIVTLMVVCSAATLKKDEPKLVYAFGFSSSFTDSVAYYTEIQLLDSVKLTKEGFLPRRDAYSYQFKSYLIDNQIQANATTMIYFSENKKKLEKELNKLLGKYKKSNTPSVVRVESDKFSFKKPEE